MVDFKLENPLRSIKNNNDIAFNFFKKKISYAELIKIFEKFSIFLNSQGISSNHRILIIQNHYDLESAYISVLSCMWHGCSPAYSRSNRGLTDILIQSKIKEFNPTAIYLLDENQIVILKDLKEHTKLYKTEAICNFTHGPSADTPFNCNPIHWKIDHNNQYGHNLESIILAAHDIVEEPINQITDMDPNIPYFVDVLLRSICTGGKITIIPLGLSLEEQLTFKNQITESEINFICGFKKTFVEMFYKINKRISIKGCEFGGGPLDEEIFNNIFKRFNPKKMVYHFSSFVFGYTFMKILTKDSDSHLLNVWNKDTDLYSKDKSIMFDIDGNLYIKMNSLIDSEFKKTGDKFTVSNSLITYSGRTSDDFIPRLEAGGKIYIHEVENIVRSFRGVKDAKIFVTNNIDYLKLGHDSYGMVYCGEISESELTEKLKKNIKSKKIPRSIFLITEDEFNNIQSRNDCVNVLLK
jgi:hypothetical protein